MTTKLDAERALALLEQGEMELLGLLPRASNYTFAVRVRDADTSAVGVYKPRDGETPLWDFPDGTLYKREIAAYVVSEALGFGFVPPTILRGDGPYGLGSLQLYIDTDPGEHYFTLLEEHTDVFRRVAAFDIVVNNADRKSGHCMIERGTGRIFVVDHGVCFHDEPKLRTVIWDFAGEALPVDARAALDAFTLDPPGVLRDLLTPHEIEMMLARATALVRAGSFPAPPDDRRAYPWPPV